MFERILRIAIGVGALIDIGVALVSLFAQSQFQPLFDIPLKDPAMATIGGGEFLIPGLLYVALLFDLRRFSPLLWILALDQVFAAALPAIEMMRHNVPVTIKTVGPMPLNLILAAIYVIGARALDRRRARVAA